MRRVVRVLASLFLLSGAALVLTPTTAGAASLDQSGWWYRATTQSPTTEIPQPIPGGAPVVPVTAPGPPTVSAEQLHVEGSAAGAVAVAAVKYTLVEGESNPVLTLTPEPGSTVPPNAIILACRAALEWTPPETNPGAWETKPLADCSKSVQGQILDAASGGGVVFPLQPLASGTSLDIIIVPGTDPALPAEARGSVFSLTFARPGPEALKTSGAGVGEADDFVPSVTFDEDYSFEPATTPSDFYTAPVSMPTFDSSVVSTAAPVVEPALEPQDQAPSVPRPVTPVAVTVEDVGAAAKKLGLVLLALGAIAAFMTSADTPSDVMGLGRFRRIRSTTVLPEPGLAGEAGVGRLRRPRVGPPPRL